MDIETRIKEDHRLKMQRAYALPLKRKIKLDQHGPLQYHSSILKHPESNLSR